jgi:hypothetical protein
MSALMTIQNRLYVRKRFAPNWLSKDSERFGSSGHKGVMVVVGSVPVISKLLAIVMLSR